MQYRGKKVKVLSMTANRLEILHNKYTQQKMVSLH